MSKLPTISSPLFELTVPSTGKKVKYRPFKVKEEKIMLIANESKDADQAILSIKQIINNCFQDLDVETLAMFDLEYLLLELRSKSVDNTISFAINDPSGEKISLTLELENVKLVKDESHTKNIKLNDDYTLIMRYPTLTEFSMLLKDPNNKELTYDIMMSCMDKLVSSAGEVFSLSDYTKEEKDAFADELESPAIKAIRDFFSTMPRLRHEIPYKLSNGQEKTFVIEGMQTFFL